MVQQRVSLGLRSTPPIQSQGQPTSLSEKAGGSILAKGEGGDRAHQTSGKGMWRGVGERALRGQYHVLESSSHPNLKKHCMDNAWTSRLSGNGTEGRVDNAATAV